MEDGGSPSEVALPAGYVHLGWLGSGGMGDVYLAHDVAMDREVAVKILTAECADRPEIVQAFEDESRTMARLDHPAIVTVHARGRLPDDRPWYAMRLVRGQTLGELLREPQPVLRRLLGFLVPVARAVAYAHGQQVVHCDLKPDNVLVGPFGEVQVLDWGIAQAVGALDDSGMGTPPYRAPEQRPGGRVVETTDVWALGQMLDQVLRACGAEILTDLVERARALVPAERPSALELADAIQATLDGEAARERALAMLRAAESLERECADQESRAAALRDEARAMLAALGEDAPPLAKQPAWALFDEADAAETQAELTWTRWLRRVHGALQTSPDLVQARDRLADYHYRCAQLARSQEQKLDELRHRELLTQYDRGQYARYLAGRSALTLLTEPEGIEVVLWRYEVRHRRLQRVRVGPLGRTPLDEVDVPSGSLSLELVVPGGRSLHLPALVEPGESWATIRPGDRDPLVHRVPALRSPDDCWMPAGWFVSGGDPLASDGIARRRLFVGDRIVQRHVVTNRRYLAFLDDLFRQGREDEAWEVAPGLQLGGGAVEHAVRLGPDGFVFEVGVNGVPPELDWPVRMVSWQAARRFATWWSAKTGEDWRLPHDQEAEKAARGVDGRPLPWGHHFEPAWARVAQSAGSPPRPARIHEHPEDCSVYGVRGVAGNVRVWCGNGYDDNGPPDGSEILAPAGELGRYRMVRGSHFLAAERAGRCASRFAALRGFGRYGVGIRLIRPLRFGDP